MKKLMFVLFAAILVMSLGCSKSSDSPTSPSAASPIAGTWKLSTTNGVAPSGSYTVVIDSNGNWTDTSVETTGATCTGNGTSSTNGNNLTTVTTGNSCSSATTYPKTSTVTYTVTTTTLTITYTSGGVSVYTKQ